MKKLTKAEVRIMKILWEIKQGIVNDIISQLPDPKPSYNTVSTFLRILVKKGFLSCKQSGHFHEYYPLVLRDEYCYSFTNDFLEGYFEDSLATFIAFYLEKEKVDTQELEKMRFLIQNVE